MKVFLYFLLFLFLVSDVEATGIGVAPSDLSFKVEEGQTQRREITAYNLKEEPSEISVESSSDFLKFQYDRFVEAESSGKIVVEVDASGLKQGKYSGKIYVSLVENSETVAVEVGTAIGFEVEVVQRESSGNFVLVLALMGSGLVFVLIGLAIFFKV